MNLLIGLPLWVNVGVLLAAAVVIGYAGVRLAGFADQFADVTNLGEAMTGAIFLGASTSLSGIVTSTYAAYGGYPELSISNAVGGIAAQTAFLAIGDLAYRRANLEHAAASLPNLISATALAALLSMVIILGLAPPVTIWQIHPATPVLFLAYIFSLRLSQKAREHPMWDAEETPETKQDKPDQPPGETRQIGAVLWRMLVLAMIVSIAGYFVAESGIAVSTETGLSQGFVGALFTAVATSTPELVTTLAAVRRGALTLAVSGIVGGNVFDVLFVGFADIAYRDGSIYHAVSSAQYFTVALAILLTATLLLGLLRRERHGFANIGFESVFILLLYAGGVAVLAWGF